VTFFFGGESEVEKVWWIFCICIKWTTYQN